MPDEWDVCQDNLTRGKKRGLSLKNNTSSNITVNPAHGHLTQWPFEYPTSTFPVLSNDIQGVVLKNTPGTYYYDTVGCPGSTLGTNPKTVIVN